MRGLYCWRTWGEKHILDHEHSYEHETKQLLPHSDFFYGRDGKEDGEKEERKKQKKEKGKEIREGRIYLVSFLFCVI